MCFQSRFSCLIYGPTPILRTCTYHCMDQRVHTTVCGNHILPCQKSSENTYVRTYLCNIFLSAQGFDTVTTPTPFGSQVQASPATPFSRTPPLQYLTPTVSNGQLPVTPVIYAMFLLPPVVAVKSYCSSLSNKAQSALYVHVCCSLSWASKASQSST